MAETITHGIVLEIYQNEENLFLVSFFTSQGKLVLAAQGLDKPLSKNRVNLQIGSLVEIEYFKARLEGKIGKLKKAHLLKSIDISDTKNAQFVEKITKLLQNFTSSNHLMGFLPQLYSLISPLNNDRILTFLYAQSLIYFGIAPNFNSCRICLNMKNLIDFDLLAGGFICNRHGQKETDKSMEYLQAIWCSFHSLKKYLIFTNNSLNQKILIQYKEAIIDNGYFI
ncbi:DNA repair protein RecO [Mycoplasmopsis gallopavonis]|uniref:Recombinational DNA repair protein O n=1 Tax=Mycoplasmopsis gallopavonis TaxID=76629 RepID=A0A449AYT4_9BACT|nr:DNA repair protein RecO [Mycoplasmopsis gallopavonis]RIV16685.1 DNA repair protein RecO [Mycoplasmopsis gallopavonis]VEU72654.1 recombinational DNA repair protein O [Mycoplasmopsis gallopavonis]